MRKTLVVCLVVVFLASCVDAATIRVGACEYGPDVKFVNGKWTGLDIELWDEVCKINKWDYEVSRVNLKNRFEVLDANINLFDVTITGSTITRKRELLCDFSYPYLDSGLRILSLAE